MKRFLQFINEDTNTMKLYYSDKFRTLLTEISNGNSADAKKTANFLLLSEDSNQMLDKYTLVDITDKNDYVSYIQVNRILKEFPGKEDRVNNDSKFWADEKLRTKHKIGKWTTHIYKDVYKTTNFTPTQIEEFSNVYKATYDAMQTPPEFVILKGDDIKWGYSGDNYADGDGTLANSCMRYKYCQEYFDIYTENKDVCSLLVLKDSDNQVKGRALLWVLDDDTLYMDRIYIANDSDKYLFTEWAVANNYKQYLNDSSDKSVTVGKTSYTYYPYMDTFISFDTNSGILTSNGNGSDFIKLQDTSGGYQEVGVWSDYESEYIDEDYAVWIESIDDFVHQDNSVYLSYKDTYEIDDTNYRRKNDLPALVYSECCETWLYVDDSSYSEILKDYVDISNSEYVEFIINSDNDTDIVPDSYQYSHLYKEVNSEPYSIDYVKNPYTNEYGFYSDIVYSLRNELVKELGEDSTKIHSELVEKFLNFRPDKNFLLNISKNIFFIKIQREYYYNVKNKPTEIDMLPAIYLGGLIKIKSDEIYMSRVYQDKLNYILNLIDNDELSQNYNNYIESNSMIKNILKFASSFDYTLFDEDIYKRILYNRIFS